MDKEKTPILEGREPSSKPPRVQDFEELEKKSIETVIDAIKYIAASAGIIMAIYSQIIQDHIKVSNTTMDGYGKLLLFLPLFSWFISIATSVVGIYPHSYIAKTDKEKEAAVIRLKNNKIRWLVASITSFLIGVVMFLYTMAAQIWQFYPF